MNRLVIALLLSSGWGWLHAEEPKADPEPDPIAELLAREIIGDQLAQEEVQAYTEGRVAPLPDCQTADEWQMHADRMRQETLDKVVFRGAAADWRDADVEVVWLDDIAGGPGYTIRKLRYEALPGMWIPALLYVPDVLEGPVPVCMNVNGHDRLGKAAPYKQIRCINQAKRGMLALNLEWFNMGQLRGDNYAHSRLNQLDLCGASGVAPFYLAMQRGLDILLGLEHADPQRVAVSGLSGGGWQTIFISSLDTRVTLANPVAGYSSFRTRARYLTDLGDSEQTPTDLAMTADYAHLTAMLAPRAALLTYNAEDDCCFQAAHALPPLLEAAAPIYKLFGQEARLRSHVNVDPGTHNFERDNREALYRMLGDHFYGGSPGFDATEIASDDELKTADELNVPLPEANADLHTLATALAADLPLPVQWPADPGADAAWQDAGRQRLTDILRYRPLSLDAEQQGEAAAEDVRAVFWRLTVDRTWTLPAVELAGPEAMETVLLLADEGRASLGDLAKEHLAAGRRVVALDPFYFGESQMESHGYLFAMLLASVGDRPLGLQAGQIAAAAEWAAQEFEAPVKVIAVGPRLSVAALCAAGLAPQAVAGVELHGALGSLKQLIEENRDVTYAPELFCLGLLQEFDLRRIAALSAPCPIRLHQPSDRAQEELAGVATW